MIFSRINGVLEELIASGVCHRWKLKKVVKAYKIVSTNNVFVTRVQLQLDQQQQQQQQQVRAKVLKTNGTATTTVKPAVTMTTAAATAATTTTTTAAHITTTKTTPIRDIRKTKDNSDQVVALFEATMEQKRSHAGGGGDGGGGRRGGRGGGRRRRPKSHDSSFVINLAEIGRLDTYGNTSWCIVDKYPTLKEYCYCHQQYPKR